MPEALPTFFHQPETLGPLDNIYRNLCAFYSIRHFLGDREAKGYLSKTEFFVQATKIYIDIGMSKEDAEELANAGNDPAVIDRFLPNGSESRPQNLATRPKMLIALADKAHFITVLKIGNKWYNYDSLLPEPALIASIDAFLGANRGQRYWSS